MTDSTGEDSSTPERETVPDSQDDVGGHCSTVDCVRPIVDDVLLPVVSDAQEPDVEREAAAAEEGYHDDDGAVWFEQGGEPEVVLRLPRDVPVPSKEMVRRHRAAGHCPYRSWCEDCVRGACNAPAHRARDPKPIGEIPELHSDYGFFRDKKGDKLNTVNVLVTRDRRSAGICAHVVPKKGVGGGFAVKQYLRDVKKFGYHHKIMIRSDGEPAIRDLLDRVSSLRASETILEATPSGDSKANGRAERAVQAIEKQTRVLKLSVERHFGVFSVKHACFPWLVMHGADVLTKFVIGSGEGADGLTAYERIKGRAYSGTMFEFGQCILFKVSAKVQGGDMRARWEKGMWLGKRFVTDEHVISTTNGIVVRSSAVKLHPDTEYDSQLFDALVGVPWDPAGKNKAGCPKGEYEDLRELPRLVVPRAADEPIPQSRRMMISRDLILRFGPTEGCAKCRFLMAGDQSQPALGHNAACRTRIEALLAQDPVLGKRLLRAQQRQDEFFARRIEAGDESAKRSRASEDDDVELQPGPGGASESRVPDLAEEEGDMQDDTVSYRTDVPRSRAQSTATYGTDVLNDVDMPIPAPDERLPSTSASSSSPKRKRDGPTGDDNRAEDRGGDEDPEDPVDDGMAGSLEEPKVLMLGEKNPFAKDWQHPGKYDLCELFSPPRVSAVASARGLRGGWALDVNFVDPVSGSAWDLSEPRAQEKVWKMIRRDKPLVVGLSPECTLFSALQNLRKTDIPADEMAKAVACVRFCVDVAEFQMARGRFFYFEHPLTASSWTMPELEKLQSMSGVEDVVLHMCSFGLTATDCDGDGLVKKPTRVLTNMPSIASALDRRCSNDHRHVHLLSGKAKAAIHNRKICPT